MTLEEKISNIKVQPKECQTEYHDQREILQLVLFIFIKLDIEIFVNEKPIFNKNTLYVSANDLVFFTKYARNKFCEICLHLFLHILTVKKENNFMSELINV